MQPNTASPGWGLGLTVRILEGVRYQLTVACVVTEHREQVINPDTGASALTRTFCFSVAYLHLSFSQQKSMRGLIATLYIWLTVFLNFFKLFLCVCVSAHMCVSEVEVSGCVL